jgi:hypothetical protein
MSAIAADLSGGQFATTMKPSPEFRQSIVDRRLASGALNPEAIHEDARYPESGPNPGFVNRQFGQAPPGHDYGVPMSQRQTSTPGESLITGKSETKGKRKRIYGMGGSQGTEQSGTVKKPTLGGE